MTRDILSAIHWAWRDAHLLLCCSLDGVIAENGELPGDTRVPSSRRALLASLASLNSMTVCVTSGRRLAQIQTTIGRDRRMYYVGLRGLEIEGPAVSFFHLGAARSADVLTPLAAALQDVARETPGIAVEHRNLHLAVRLGWVANADTRARVARRVADLAAPFARTHRLRVIHCGTDIEILPDVRWTTADALREIKLAVERRSARCVAVVMGNGVGDDDIFGLIHDSGLGIHVGQSDGPAAFRVTTLADVDEILLGLVGLGTGRPGTLAASC
jgi:trehalose-phosphatase